MKRSTEWITAVFFLFLLVPFSALAASAREPLDALQAAQQAIDEADYNLFSKFVDVDSIVKNGAADVLKTLQAEAKSGRLPKDLQAVGVLLGALNLEDNSQMNMLVQMVASDARAMVASGISGGHFAGKPNGKTKMQGVGGLLSGVSSKAKKIIPGKLVEQHGGTAVVSAVLEDAGAGSFPLELDMKQAGEGWKVTGVHNVKPLVQKALKNVKK